MLGDFRQVRRIVGRRDAIRYGGLGLLSVVLTACGAKEDDGRSGTAPGDRPAKATVTGAAVEAFAQGAWQLSFTPQGEVNDEYARIDVTGRRWSLDGDDLAGSFTLAAGRLTVTVDGMTTDNVWAGAGLPGSVGGNASHTLQWGHDAASGEGDPGSPVDTTPFPLPVTWDGTTLRIQARNGVVIAAVRA
ncbi:hypothetical protein ABZ371_05420 [Streptomyces sp. NPDC005899]|uniref:hypothetical protein n=1 Tax=Streptomyces sp. NPDC005899 TaxID=3155716 RepID=UPI0033EA62F4